MTSIIDLIRVSVGNRELQSLRLEPSEIPVLYEEADKQAITGVLADVVAGCVASPKSLGEYKVAYFQWLGELLIIEGDNRRLNRQTAAVTGLFEKAGMRTCVLKGQGMAQKYPHPEWRISGDIDLWVDAPRKKILEFIKEKGWNTGLVSSHHIKVSIFEGTSVEIHFNPGYAYSAIRYFKYKEFYKANGERQFSLLDEALGFSYPTDSFNAVYVLLHIFRHVLNDGIRLRQMMDYYYTLLRLTDDERKGAMKTLKGFGLGKFTAAVMYVEQEVFGLQDGYLLCKPDTRLGAFLLDDIMNGGNFGQGDDRNGSPRSKFGILLKTKRLLSMWRFCPSEVLWAPAWKVWHTAWKKWIKHKLKSKSKSKSK